MQKRARASCSPIGDEVNASLRRLVAEETDHSCEYCLVHEEDVYHGCEVDHIVSLKHGGMTTRKNLAYACFHPRFRS